MVLKLDKAFWRSLILYGIIGGLSSGLDWVLFTLLYKFGGMNEFIANVISTHAGIFLSFFLNSRYNFKKTDDFWGRFIPFYLTGLFGLLLSTGILALGAKFGVNAVFTKLAAIVIVALVQFFINRAVAFRDKAA